MESGQGAYLDRWARIMFCTDLGFTEKSTTRPFSAKQWKEILWRLSGISEASEFLLTASEEKLRGYLPLVDALRVSELRRDRHLAETLAFLMERGISILLEGDEAFPSNCELSWQVLYCFGDETLLNELPENGMAIIGARDAGEAPLALARRLGKSCAQRDVIVVSGGADGVDSSAQYAALNSGGASVFLLPYGLASRQAMQKIDGLAGRFLLLSAAPPLAGFSVQLAMSRNHAIYKLSRVAAVIGAKEGKGGTWAGAIEALRRNGSYRKTPVCVFSGYSEGDEALVKAGASLIAEDDKGFAELFSKGCLRF